SNTQKKKVKKANLSINEIETEKISKFIFKIVAVTLFFTVLYQFFYDLGDFTEFLIFAIALGISVTPEALPLIITYSLSKGAEKLYQNKLIVKKLNYIEDLGAIDVLCSDKTGTLTENSLKIAGKIINFLKKNKNHIIKSKNNSFFIKKIKSFGAKKVDYLSAFNLKKLKKTNKPSLNTRVFLAYHLSGVRLIDNF
ncbi:MAG: hypothetical protein EBV78_00335, partial [Candidatus Fonsibacter lacus]|nr:hypothetical protein [Candidatus Fonsibacter lacus]